MYLRTITLISSHITAPAATTTSTTTTTIDTIASTYATTNITSATASSSISGVNICFRSVPVLRRNTDDRLSSSLKIRCYTESAQGGRCSAASSVLVLTG